MENFLEVDLNTFVFEKSLQIFKKINNIQFDPDDVEIVKFPLSGISNTIFKVEIKFKNKFNSAKDTSCLHEHQFIRDDTQTPPAIKINHLFFKVFGRISVLVDRDLETFLMTQLCEKGFGPRIYDTDSKTYRIEEYFDGLSVLHTDKMLDYSIISKMITNFANLNILGGEINYYMKLIGNKNKSEYFKILKDEDKKTNIINFLLIKMKPYALRSFNQFKQNYLNDSTTLDDQSSIEGKIKHVEFILNNLDDLLYQICPDKALFVIGHNDSHPLNILIKPDSSKVILCDYEYSAYNFIGFDIVNYLIETCFLLSADEFPFYQFYRDKLKLLENNEGFTYYLSFFEYFEENSKEIIEKYPLFADLINECKTNEYFYRIMGISSLLWFTFAVIYYDYDTIKNRSGYDYFNYSLERLLIYDKLAKSKLGL
jgi:thiamine kinase-like enzyme